MNKKKNKLKGVGKLNEGIKAAFKGFGIKKMILGQSYAYYYYSKKVMFKLTENEYEDEWFKEFIFERFGYEVEHPFILSILHEIGHHKANEEITGAISDFCNAEKARISKEMESANERESKILEWQYFNLPDEIMATQWAVSYAQTHPKKIKKMWKRCEETLVEFYAKNID